MLWKRATRVSSFSLGPDEEGIETGGRKCCGSERRESRASASAPMERGLKRALEHQPGFFVHAFSLGPDEQGIETRDQMLLWSSPKQDRFSLGPDEEGIQGRDEG